MLPSSARKLIAIGALLVAILLFGRLTTIAQSEPRPWLCRDLPVFSATQPITWSARRTGAGPWLVSFMRYDPAGGGHDGFTVVSTRPVSGHTSGRLGSGQYYVVALHLTAGHWICPANESEEDELPAGAIGQICFGKTENSCDLELSARVSR